MAQSGALIALPATISIEDAEGLKSKMTNVKSRYRSIALDFRKLDEIDPAGIQLLSSFALECANEGREFGCLGPLNEGVREKLLLSGILVSTGEDDYIFPFLYSEGVKLESD